MLICSSLCRRADRAARGLGLCSQLGLYSSPSHFSERWGGARSLALRHSLQIAISLSGFPARAYSEGIIKFQDVTIDMKTVNSLEDVTCFHSFFSQCSDVPGTKRAWAAGGRCTDTGLGCPYSGFIHNFQVRGLGRHYLSKQDL